MSKTKMNKERINSLRKEQTIKEYQKRGIDETIVDFRINISNPLDEMTLPELQKRVLSSLKRQIKKNLNGMTIEEAKAYARKLSFGTSTVELQLLDKVKTVLEGDDLAKSALKDVQQRKNIVELLESASKKNVTFNDAIVGNIVLPEIYSGNYKEFTAYGVFQTSIPRRFEQSKWSLSRSKMESVKLMNLEEILSRVLYYNTMEKFILENEDLYYELSVNKDNHDEKGIDKEKITERGQDYLLVMLPEFLVQTNSVVMKVDQDMSVYSSHAKTFETKKHINKETLEAMKDNHFLKKYGYVEIDNQVDLDKFNRLSKEFNELKDKIYIPKADDHSFRIKRIGHYRAGGIYFPLMNATVISVNSPSSYIHELGHQLDYTLMDKETALSEMIAFRPIIEEYRSLVRDAVRELPKDDPFYKQWTGNSSANASYYLQPTEIFARSYELYIKGLGIETSFAKESFKQSEIYPENEEFLSLVNDYFENLFSFFKPVTKKERKEEDKVMVADTTPAKAVDPIEQFKGTEQLSFF